MIQHKQVQPFTMQENMYFRASWYLHAYLYLLHSSNPQSGGGSFSLSLSAEHYGHEYNPVGKDKKEKTLLTSKLVQKVTVSLYWNEHVRKTYSGLEIHFHTLRTSLTWRWKVSFKYQPLTLEKTSPGRLCKAQDPFGSNGKQKNPFCHLSHTLVQHLSQTSLCY